MIGLFINIDLYTTSHDLYTEENTFISTEATSGHATGFAVCDTQWYYYDNEKGVFKVTVDMIKVLIDYNHEDYELGLHPDHGGLLCKYKRIKNNEKFYYRIVEQWNNTASGFEVVDIVPAIVYIFNDINMVIEHPIFNAVKTNNTTLLSTTLSIPYINNNINMVQNGLTPLRIASYNRFIDCVEILIKQGADVNVISPRDGSTPLDVAAHKNFREIVKLLLDNGAKIGELTLKHAHHDIKPDLEMHKLLSALTNSRRSSRKRNYKRKRSRKLFRKSFSKHDLARSIHNL